MKEKPKIEYDAMFRDAGIWLILYEFGIGSLFISDLVHGNVGWGGFLFFGILLPAVGWLSYVLGAVQNYRVSDV